MTETKEQATARYMVALHSIQTGHSMNPDKSGEIPKHLRVGIDARAADMEGLATLLISKGVFTAEEYHTALADAMEREVRRFEAELSEKYDSKVTLL